MSEGIDSRISGMHTVEAGVALSVGVEITSVGISDTGVSVCGVGASASIARASGLSVWSGRVRSESSGHRVCLPDVHLGTARSVLSGTGVGTVGRAGPSIHVGLISLLASAKKLITWCETYLAVDELQITWALSITVSNTVLGSSLVAWVDRLATIRRHADEVKGTVQSTRKMRNIDVERELLVQELEQLIGVVVLQHEQSGSDVLASDKAKLQGVTGCCSTVCASVVGTIKSTVCSTSLVVRAESFVPGVSGVAVGAARCRMQPSPVRIQNDFTGDIGAARGGTCLPCHRRVNFSCEGTDLLTGHKGKEQGGEGESGRHDG